MTNENLKPQTNGGGGKSDCLPRLVRLGKAIHRQRRHTMNYRDGILEKNIVRRTVTVMAVADGWAMVRPTKNPKAAPYACPVDQISQPNKVLVSSAKDKKS